VTIKLAEAAADAEPGLSGMAALLMLALVTICVALQTDLLIDTIEDVAKEWQLSEAFIGVILLPIVGNAAEHATAVTMAAKQKLDLSIGVAIGSSTQIALMLVPVITLLSWAIDEEMTLAWGVSRTSLYNSQY
jgi:Ca2+:H+ antiporter